MDATTRGPHSETVGINSAGGRLRSLAATLAGSAVVRSAANSCSDLRRKSAKLS